MTQVLLTPLLGAATPAISETLSGQGMEVDLNDSGLAKLTNWQGWDCVLTNAADFLDFAQSDSFSKSRPTPIIVVTEAGQVREAVQCLQQGASDYLEWDAQAEELAGAIERATQRASLPSQHTEPEANEFTMAGECPPIQRLRNQVLKVANTDSTVLVLGEPGSGKELIARALHRASARARRPLITLNCTSVPGSLIDAELFGSVTAQGLYHPGLIQAADGGTLFLDEVAELPKEAQTRLLSVVEDSQVRPVGGTEYQPVDVRLLAATHRPLQHLTNSGHFRTDLYYRLSVFTLEAPPLRQRGQDALLLAKEFVATTAERLGKPAAGFDEQATAALLEYSWPGNVRELVNVIERAVILSTGDTITLAELAIDTSKPAAPATGDEQASQEDQTSLEDYFVKFVTEHQDGLTETELAERLGISRKSLWERRQRLNIPRKRTKKRGPRREGI